RDPQWSHITDWDEAVTFARELDVLAVTR
ncbi:MAG: hypothetical protein JWN77_1456, partial [Frankiales bacterium]|nr:hypothetical protein [Frankiales bacterium]